MRPTFFKKLAHAPKNFRNNSGGFKKRIGFFLVIILLAIASYGVFVGRAANQTWGANGGSAWYTVANWAGGAFPGLQGAAASNTDTATWTSAATNTTFGINMTTASLNLGAVSIDSTRTINTSVGDSGATAGSLRLYGATVNSVANVIARNNGTGVLTLQAAQSGTMSLVLSNTTDNIINIDNTGGVTITAIMSDLAGGAKHLTLGGAGSGKLTLSGANTFTGGVTIGSGNTLNINSLAALGTGTFTINGGTIDNTSTAAIGPFTNNNAQTWNGDFTFTGGATTTHDLNFGAGAVSLGTTAGTTRTITASAGTLSTGGVISNGTTANSLTKAGAGTLTLSGASSYSGNTTITAGTLGLSGSGSIVNSPTIEIAGGATFDVTGLTTSLTLASGQALKGSGTATTGTIVTTATKGLTTAANSPLQFTAFNGATAPLTISGAGTVTLASGNPVTVNTTVALGAGDYTLISKGATPGIVAGSVPTSLTIGGSGLAAGMSGILQLTGSQLVLHVAAAGSLQFSGAPYSDSETNADHTFTVNVSRTGGSNGAVSANYAVTDGTATSPSDYIASPASGTLNWADGDSANKTFNITVKGDTTFEPDETVNLAISGPTGGATLGSPSSTTLTITNDDPAPDMVFNSDGSLAAGTYHNVTINNCGTFVTLTGNVTITGTLTINSCAHLLTDTFIVSGAGSFVMAADSWLHIGDANGITSGVTLSGNIQVTGGRTYSSAGNYVYTGTVNQAVGNGLPGTVANLLISNTGGAGSNTVTGNSGQVVTVLLEVIAGVYVSASDYVDVQIDNGATLSLSGAITVSGNWTNNGTFIANGFAVTFDGTTNQTIGGANSTPFATLAINNAGAANNNIVTLAKDTTVSTALNVMAGVFDQGTAPSANLSSNTVTVSSGATFQNFGTGDLTLSGNVSNAGTINFNANGTACGDADSILIRSSVGGTQRTWSGAGTFSMTDVDVQDQRTPLAPPPVAIIVFSGADSGNNLGWVFSGTCTAGTYTWIGGLNADWQVATNWSPTRTTPAPGDILFIDFNATPSPIISNVPTQTIAALRLTNGASATLNASAVAPPQTLTVSGATGTDLSVPTGNLLTLAGANALKLNVASGSTGTIGGQIIFQDAAHRLIGNAASAVLFHSGALFTTASGFTGNPFGTGGAGDGATNSIQFESGSTYFHNAGLSPFGSAGLGPVTVFQTGSEADWLTSAGFQASDRTYANLVIGNPTTATSVSDSGAGGFQFDNLTVKSTGSANSSISYDGSSGPGAIFVRGNITSTGVGNGGTLQDVTLTPGFSSMVISKPGGGTLTFGNDGSNARAIDLEGSAAPVAVVGGGTTLALSRVVLLGISNPQSRELIVQPTGSITGGSNGYVVGSLTKQGVPASFIFPVGTVGAYSPVDLANTSGGGNLTVAARTPQQPVLTSGTSLHRYWTLTKVGVLTTDLTFHYLDGDVNGNEANYQLIVVDSGNATHFPNNCPSTCVNTGANTIVKTGVQTFSDWTAGEPNAPTAVRLAGFAATRTDNEVMIQWQSGYEARNLGYYVYREQNGRRTQITPSLVAGSALVVGQQTVMNAGLSYTWYDQLPAKSGRVQADALSPVSYWLEDVDLNGTRTLHGPIAPALVYRSPNEGRPAQSDTFKDVQRRAPASGTTFSSWPADFADQHQEMLTPPTPTGKSTLTQREIANLPGLKIAVSKTGWYRVTLADMLAAGFNPKESEPRLQLYANAVQVPIKLSGNTLTADTDYLEFFGHGLDSPTAGAQTYYLVVGNSSGKRISMNTDGRPADPSGPQSYSFTIERKDRFIYYAALLNGDADNTFGHVVRSTPVDETLPVGHPDLSGGQAQLEVSLVGVTQQAHNVTVSLNGQSLGTVDFSNNGHPTRSFAVPASLLLDGDNTVQFASLGGDTDISLVDTMRLTYPHLYAADNNALAISINNARTKRVSGFTAGQIRAVDITDPKNMVEVQPLVTKDEQGAYTADLQVPSAGARTPRTLLVFSDTTAARPDTIASNEPSAWGTHTSGSDYVIITTRDLKANVEPLAALRRAQGMVVDVVDVEDLYDEFSFGMHSPQAIKDFLDTATANWQRKPHFVLLAGDASYDPRNYAGQGFNDLVPTKLLDTALLETASDDWLADFDGDGVADLAIGRLPVRTAGAMAALVGKIINYENMTPDPARGAMLVADGTFESASSSLQSLLPPGMPVQTINRSSADDATIHNQIITSINQGPKLANYFGHGSNGVWTGASLLSTPDAPALTNQNRLSVFLMMTCFNGYFHDAYHDSLAEALMKSPGGAVAVWASSGMTETGEQTAIDQELYRQLFGGSSPALGDAVRAAKQTTSDADVRRTWILFGDPAMRLR